MLSIRSCLCAFILGWFIEPAWALVQETPKDAAKQEASAAVSSSDKLGGLDQFIEDTMKQWKVPGLAVAVVQDGKVVHMKGYGFRDVDKQLPVTPQTIFAIGSISKSFTAT